MKSPPHPPNLSPQIHMQFSSPRSNSLKVGSILHLGPERVLSYRFLHYSFQSISYHGNVLQGQLTQ